MAEERGVKIKYIIETHFHADFVSGHIDLAKATGAPIVYGPNAKANFDIQIVEDGEVLTLGDITLTAIHTPGHTPESTCFLLKNEEGNDYCIFTGDTLFVGDVGRPDLLDKTPVHSKETMASWLYESLNTKLKTLADDVIVYPAHGPGSSCGKNLGPETFSTIGEQKADNYAMQDLNKAEFVEQVLDGIQAPPSYFFDDVAMNKNGYKPIDVLVKTGLNAMDLEDFENELKKGALVIDSRVPDIFERGFIPGSINIGLNGQYAIWAAELFSLDRKIILVCSEGREEESVTRLARVGFENVAGFLKGGFKSYADSGKEIDLIISIDPYEFSLDYKHDDIKVLDVRKQGEWDTAHLGKAKHVCLSKIADNLEIFENDKNPVYIHCAGGYRSMIAASYLRQNGFKLIKNVLGGFNKIKDEEGLDILSEAVELK